MPTDDEAKGKLLTTLARNAIAGELGQETRPLPRPPWLDENGAVFVTLTQDGELRGCIGSLEAQRRLADDVMANARAAAFRDPRFAPLAREELARTHIEVSILTPAEPMTFSDEEDALRQLRPGIDGVVLECAGHRATFLPQVWAQLPQPRRFLSRLKLKAGLPADFWSSEVRLSRYRVDKFEEAS